MRFDMGDLDTSLIQEFANRPAFYNKTSPHYKDKAYIEHAWLEISTKLGYSSVLLKDRIYQLRNRYNLEKRKVESMRCDGILDAKSSWPLFGYLTFLDGHIRPRKSYKSMMRRGYRDEEDEFLQQAHMPMVEIKYERDHNNDVSNMYPCSEYGEPTVDVNMRQQQQQNGEHFINPANFLDDTESEHDLTGNDNSKQSIQLQPQQMQQQLQQQLPPSTNNHHTNNSILPDVRPDIRPEIRPDMRAAVTSANNLTLRNINSMKRSYAAENSMSHSYQNKFKMPRPDIYGTGMRQLNQQQMLHRPLPPRPAPHQSSDKFSAFGSFITSSLLDLPEDKALHLVEKFTNELVRALIEKGQQPAPATVNNLIPLDDGNHI